MKKILFSIVATTVALSAFAQTAKSRLVKTSAPNHTIAARTTAVGDTLILQNALLTDTPTLYYAINRDSGFVAGTDAFGDKGFAERYTVNGADSSVIVMGVIAEFSGRVNPASTKNVIFNAWNVAAKSLSDEDVSGHLYNSGLPNTSVASVTMPITHIGIATSDTAIDTFKIFRFPTPTAKMANFFVGYTIAYNPLALAGDTIGVLTTKIGVRHLTTETIAAGDTVINNVNATMYSDGTWHDNYYENFGIKNHYFMFALVKIASGLSVNGVTKNGFTFFGNYPNPATTETNIKFAVAQNTTVTISVTNMAGQVVKTIEQNCNAGTQTIALNTSDLAAGQYIYLVRTAQGEGMASQMTIIK